MFSLGVNRKYTYLSVIYKNIFSESSFVIYQRTFLYPINITEMIIKNSEYTQRFSIYYLDIDLWAYEIIKTT